MIRTLVILFLLTTAGLSHADPGSDLTERVTDEDAEIYAIDASPSGQFMVAVGEDSSERTRKLQMMDEHHESVILVSTDAGKSWARNSAGGDSIPFDNVIVLDEQQAVISGSIEGAGGIILRTQDSGNNWSLVYEGGMIHDLARNDEASLWAAGYGLLHSTNGGQSWSVTGITGGFFYVIHAVDDKTLITFGDQGLLRTTDAGKQWHAVTLPENMGGFNGIEQRGDQLRMTSWNDEILVSEDRGINWRKL